MSGAAVGRAVAGFFILVALAGIVLGAERCAGVLQ